MMVSDYLTARAQSIHMNSMSQMTNPPKSVVGLLICTIKKFFTAKRIKCLFIALTRYVVATNHAVSLEFEYGQGQDCYDGQQESGHTRRNAVFMNEQ